MRTRHEKVRKIKNTSSSCEVLRTVIVEGVTKTEDRKDSEYERLPRSSRALKIARFDA